MTVPSVRYHSQDPCISPSKCAPRILIRPLGYATEYGTGSERCGMSGLSTVVGSIVVAVTMMIVVIPTAALWAAGGRVLNS
jgi:hypothetical protein